MNIFKLVIVLSAVFFASCSTTTTRPDGENSAFSNSQSFVSKTKIRLVQQQLHELGFKPGPRDGSLGPRTENAIIAFKKSEGINPSDGNVTSLLIKQLDRVSLAFVESSQSNSNLSTKKEAVQQNQVDTNENAETKVAALPSSDTVEASSNKGSIELPQANPNWTELQKKYHKNNSEQFKEAIIQCENGVSQDCYYAGKMLQNTGSRYKASRHSGYRYKPNKESALKYYSLALKYYDRDCKLGDEGGGCQGVGNMKYIIGELDPYADPDGYPRYIADAKNGDISALRFMNESYILAHDRMYELGLEGASGLQSAEYHRLRQETTSMAKIGAVSKKNALALMHILLTRAENTRDIDYALGVTELGENAGFKDGKAEIDHFGQLASANARFYLAETKRGFGKTMQTAETLMLSPYDNVKNEAAVLHEKARLAAAGAPPPRDEYGSTSSGEFARALTSFLVFTWSLPPIESAPAVKDYSWKQPEIPLDELLIWVK